MRLICLNIWKGKLLDPLVEFLKREAPSTDIFCFQEMTNSLATFPATKPDVFAAVMKALPDFQGFFESAQEDGKGLEMGLATFIRRNDEVEKEGDVFVYRTRNGMKDDDARTLGKNAQVLEFVKGGKEYTVVNFHGLWTGDGREDTDDRLAQSKNLRALIESLGKNRIICGDFNLTLDTKSLALVDHDLRNLIREYGITSTRNHYFPYPDKYCDYMIVDNGIKVNDFKVLTDEISDHLALLLDFE